MNQLRGADLSRYQGIINFDAVKQALDFVMIRSSFGAPDAGQNVGQYTDVQFARNRDEARRVGILHGFYHFSYSHLNDPIDEANRFCDVVGQLQEGEVLALDLEGTLNSDPVLWSLRFCNQVFSRTGVKPLIYMSKSVTTAYDWSGDMTANYGLWLAHWGSNQDPSKENTPWDFVAMLQWSDNGNIAGMNPVDTDTFNGNDDQFRKYGWHAVVNPTPPVVNPVVNIPPVEENAVPETPTTPSDEVSTSEPVVETLPGNPVILPLIQKETEPTIKRTEEVIIFESLVWNWLKKVFIMIYKLLAGE